MCSIYGTIGKNYKNIEKNFSESLHHRGPDDKGIFYDDSMDLALGHTRLSIIDLSNHAHQPMKDENYTLVFNGEIYNYKDIKKELIELGYKFVTNSDTEVVLKSYIEWREKCLNKFRGMFAFCIYDKQKEKLFLARDRFGIKPLIYTFLDDQFIFSSELKPFLNSNTIEKRLSKEAIIDYYTFGSVKQPKTILENVYQLMPSHYMEVDITSLEYKITKYYDYVKESLNLPSIKTYEEAVKKLRSELEVATKHHLVADVNVGAFLSGGVDSTAVVGLMKQYKENITTFSVGFKNKTNIIDETEIATRSAKFLGTKHYNIKIDDEYVRNIIDDFIYYLEQPSIDGINSYIVSLETAKELKVALSGLGGDEIFAGYPHFKSIIEYSNKNSNLFTKSLSLLNKLRPNRFTNRFQFYGLDEFEAMNKQRTINKNIFKILKKTLSTIDYPLSTINYQPSTINLSPIQKVSKVEIDNYLINTLLRDTDAVSMAHSLEVRPILLDHKLVEFAFRLPDNYKIKDNLLKAVFIDSVKDIIPNEVWQRKKTGFEMPFSEWLNGKLNAKFLEVSNNPALKQIFKEEYLNNLKFKIKNLKLDRRDWMDFVFMSWIERFGVNL